MKKLGMVLLLCMICCLVCVGCADPGMKTVYVTSEGNRYHKEDCSSIRGSVKTAMTRQDAVAAGYTACAICKP